MRILIVEDDKKIADAIKRGLEHEAFAVDAVYTGKDGLGFGSTVDYDVIILDRMLPEVDGLEICKILRDKGKKTPIIILTAKDAVKDRVEGLNAGADDYLVKPFAFEELIARIRAVLRRPEQVTKAILKVDNLTLDTLNYEIKRAGKEINLSSTEFRLLEYLMRNPGRVLTKEHIISHVWDYDADILPNTVEVYVSYLRNKLEKDFPKSKPLIKTINGYGYRIGE